MNSSDAPPPVLDFARVIAYAILDSTVKWTGHQVLYVGDQLLGEVPRLALCQNVSGSLTDILLFHCTNDWIVVGTSGGATVEAVKERAERAYHGVTQKWIHTETSQAEAVNWIRDNHPDSICSFCGRLPTDIEGLFTGQNSSICFMCVDAFHEQIKMSHGTHLS